CRVVVDRPLVRDVERDGLAAQNEVDDGLSGCMAQREFVEDVWVMVRQIGNYEVGIDNSLDDLLSDEAGLLYLVGPVHDHLEGLNLQHPLDDVFKQRVRPLSRLGVRWPNWSHDKARLSCDAFCCSSHVSRSIC